jgi:tRNA(Ile)-lysidine synthase
VFTPETLKHSLQELLALDLDREFIAAERRFCVGFSGGLDSTVLLHALTDCVPGNKIHAIYVNHQIQPQAQAWGEHCAEVCRQLEVSFEQIRVTVEQQSGDSLEASARIARYDAFAAVLQPNDILLTAQHQDDQAETFLIQLLRGSGPAGLAAMPAVKSFASGMHCRPLLRVSREALLQYARANELSWIEDPSNADTVLTRNFIRHDVMPVLRQRWPNVSNALARSAQHNADAAAVLASVGLEDLRKVSLAPDKLSIPYLHTLDASRRRNALRVWFTKMHWPLPSTAKLMHVEQDLIMGNNDQQAVIEWGDKQLRRYRDVIYAFDPEPAQPLCESFEIDGFESHHLEDGREFCWRLETGAGIAQAALQHKKLTIKPRAGGEQIRLAADGPTRDVKKLMQENAVPPWEREKVPFVWCENKLIAAGEWVNYEFVAAQGEPGLVPQVIEA